MKKTQSFSFSNLLILDYEATITLYMASLIQRALNILHYSLTPNLCLRSYS